MDNLKLYKCSYFLIFKFLRKKKKKKRGKFLDKWRLDWKKTYASIYIMFLKAIEIILSQEIVYLKDSHMFVSKILTSYIQSFHHFQSFLYLNAFCCTFPSITKHL